MRLIYLIDSEYDRHVGCCGVSNGFFGLRHDVVVGSDDDDSDIGHLCTTCTHSGEGFVTRCIEEGDVTTILKRYVVSTDVLRNTTSFTCDNV